MGVGGGERAARSTDLRVVDELWVINEEVFPKDTTSKVEAPEFDDDSLAHDVQTTERKALVHNVGPHLCSTHARRSAALVAISAAASNTLGAAAAAAGGRIRARRRGRWELGRGRAMLVHLELR